MNKFIASAFVLATILSTGVASAQPYYSTYSGSCPSLTQNLTVGSRGAQVSSLQSFLVGQNYPGSGSWMVTGYFGQATATALRNYQSQVGLPQTGVLDAATRAAIAGCQSGTSNYSYSYMNQNGAYPYNYNYTTPYNYNYNTAPYNYNYNYNTAPYNYNYNYNYGYNYGYNSYSGPLHIDTLSVTSALTGASVTISGTGFDYNSNTVYVGSVPVVNVASWNGNSLSFVVPQNVSGQVMIYVANSRGSSNSLSLNVINYGSGGCVYPYNAGNCGNCSYTGGCNQGQLTLTQLSPDNGAVGTSVTIYGTGFTTTGNTVHFGSGVIINASSLDGRSVSFTVPSSLTGYQSQGVFLGSYPVSVTNGAGFTSNTLNFTVTSLGSAGTPSISSVTGPNTLAAGVSGTWSITVTNPGSNYTTVSVNWGDSGNGFVNMAAPQVVYGGTQTLTFTHAYAQSGTYTVVFTIANQFGLSNTSSATVTVGGQGTGVITLSSVSPISGRTGTQITLTGSGFTSDNTVHFGVGGLQHVPSYNGTTISFTVPSYISPCDVQTPGTYCALYAQQVTPGVYQVFVSNAIGQSSQQSFTVTS